MDIAGEISLILVDLDGRTPSWSASESRESDRGCHKGDARGCQ